MYVTNYLEADLNTLFQVVHVLQTMKTQRNGTKIRLQVIRINSLCQQFIVCRAPDVIN